MKGATFKGGTHPFEGKDLSKDLPVKKIVPTGEMVYPVSQHIGAPAQPIVKPGDHVLVGQTIAEAGGFVSTDICSSVSGTVKKIEKRLTVSGAMVDSIIIENDKEYTKIEGFGEKREYRSLSKEEIRECIKKAGIVGMGGAGFPTHVKLAPKDDNAIDYVLVNGAECEPYLTSDYRMMLECPEEIIGGLKVILSLFPN
ncbi:MAG: electron transporter RnfC, partial [Lachnospiraceae bacterium]|nr:electron transporter RnfC [Lachnospiraceae bacterium]